jgi:hypothetical protein
MQEDQTATTREAYEEERARLAYLIDHPDKTITVSEYRAQLADGLFAVADAHTAMLEAR